MRFDRRSVMLGMGSLPLMGAVDFSQGVRIFEARQVVTMNNALPYGRFVAVAGDTILSVADSIDALAPWIDGRDAKIDRRFADRVLFPGLVDPHIHPMQAAVMMDMPFLAPDSWTLPSGEWPGIEGRDAYRARLARLVREGDAEPLITWGHHELFHGPLDKSVLDKIAPDRPLFVWQRSFHDIYTNSAGLESFGLGSEEAFNAAMKAANADLHHSSFERGVFSETGLAVAIAKLQPVLLSPERMRSGFAGLQGMMQSRGVTTTADLATGIFARFDAEAQLIAGNFGRADRMARAMLIPMAAELDHVDDLDAWLAEAQRKYVRDGVLLERRVKLFADGAFFAQNMRLGSPGYSDGHVGKWLTPPDDLKKQVDRYWDAGFDLHIHVNGDEGADVVLDALAALPHRLGQTVTLEHLGYCTEAQVERMLALGVMISAQPNYIRVLGEAYSRSGLGPDRAAQMNRLGTLERYSLPLGLHSDFNMAPIDPFYLAWIAETREGIDGVARAPDLALSRYKALRAITVEAAQVIGLDHMVGSIEVGKKADFVALDVDPWEAPVEMLKQMPIHATVFEGRVAEAG